MQAKPIGRVCAYCLKPGGAFSHAIQINGQMTNRYLHLRCIPKFRAKYGDK